jgi:hypothetical protein
MKPKPAKSSKNGRRYRLGAAVLSDPVPAVRLNENRDHARPRPRVHGPRAKDLFLGIFSVMACGVLAERSHSGRGVSDAHGSAQSGLSAFGLIFRFGQTKPFRARLVASRRVELPSTRTAAPPALGSAIRREGDAVPAASSSTPMAAVPVLGCGTIRPEGAGLDRSPLRDALFDRQMMLPAHPEEPDASLISLDRRQ